MVTYIWLSLVRMVTYVLWLGRYVVVGYEIQLCTVCTELLVTFPLICTFLVLVGTLTDRISHLVRKGSYFWSLTNCRSGFVDMLKRRLSYRVM